MYVVPHLFFTLSLTVFPVPLSYVPVSAISPPTLKQKYKHRPSYLFVYGSLQFRVAYFVKLYAWKEVLNQAQEEGLILIDLINTNMVICSH